jgi:hypothetical protein
VPAHDPEPQERSSEEHTINIKAWRVARASAGGKAKAANKTRRLLEATLANLTPLTDIADAKTRLDLIGTLVMRGLLTGSQAHAAAGSVRIWIEAVRAAITADRVRELEKLVEQQSVEIKRLQAAGTR